MSGFPVDAVALHGIVCCCNARGALQKFVSHGLKSGCHFTVGLCTRDPEISLRPLSKIALIHHIAIPRSRRLSMKLNRDATLRHLGNSWERSESGCAIPHCYCKLGALIYQYSRCEQAYCGSAPLFLCSLAGRIDQLRLINLPESPRFRFSSTFVLNIGNYPQRSRFCDQRFTGLRRRSTGSGPLRLTGLDASALRRPRCISRRKRCRAIRYRSATPVARVCGLGRFTAAVNGAACPNAPRSGLRSAEERASRSHIRPDRLSPSQPAWSRFAGIEAR